MRPIGKLPTALLACSIAGGATLCSALTTAQEPSKASRAKTEKAAKKKPVAKPKPKVEAKAEGAAKTAAQPVAATAGPAVQIRPLAEEAQHVARYDAAIAQVRDVVLAAEEAGKLREAVAAAAGSRVQD